MSVVRAEARPLQGAAAPPVIEVADVSLTFKQGEVVVAQLRTNVLANVFFAQRQPFSGQPVSVEAQGYQSLVVNDVSELGEDGHTLVLRR